MCAGITYEHLTPFLQKADSPHFAINYRNSPHFVRIFANTLVLFKGKQALFLEFEIILRLLRFEFGFNLISSLLIFLHFQGFFLTRGQDQ